MWLREKTIQPFKSGVLVFTWSTNSVEGLFNHKRLLGLYDWMFMYRKERGRLGFGILILTFFISWMVPINNFNAKNYWHLKCELSFSSLRWLTGITHHERLFMVKKKSQIGLIQSNWTSLIHSWSFSHSFTLGLSQNNPLSLSLNQLFYMCDSQAFNWIG